MQMSRHVTAPEEARLAVSVGGRGDSGVSMDPEAEGMPSRAGIDSEHLVAVGIVGRSGGGLQLTPSEFDRQTIPASAREPGCRRYDRLRTFYARKGVKAWYATPRYRAGGRHSRVAGTVAR